MGYTTEKGGELNNFQIGYIVHI